MAICTLWTEESATVYNDFDDVCYANDRIYVGRHAFTVAENTDICRVDVWAQAVNGDPSIYEWIVEIYDMSGTSLNTLLATSSNHQHINAQGWWQFDFTTPYTLATGTTYAIVITRSDHAKDGTNNVRIGWTTNATPPTGNGAMWANTKAIFANYTTLDWEMKLYRMVAAGGLSIPVAMNQYRQMRNN